jgi:hypothetical protein
MNDLFVCCYDEFTCIIFCDRSLKMQKLPNFIATDDDQHKVQTRSSSRDRTFGGTHQRVGMGKEDEEEEEAEGEEEFSLQILYPLTTLRKTHHPFVCRFLVRDLRSLSSHGHLVNRQGSVTSLA